MNKIKKRFEKEFSIENLKECYRNGHTFLSYEFELGTKINVGMK